MTERRLSTRGGIGLSGAVDAYLRARSGNRLGEPALEGAGEPLIFNTLTGQYEVALGQPDHRPRNCLNCGAPATGDTCDYCGTRHG